MADSNHTKMTFSIALRELLEEQPFEKIIVSDLCDRCGMNRKSFYYHFRDKYDLVNWIFDTEFGKLSQTYSLDESAFSYSFDERWRSIAIICHYFYENRIFYRNVLKVEGQNSFTAHFREYIRPHLRMRFEDMLGMKDVPEMVYDFIVDGVICAIERWLLDKDCITAEEFMFNLWKLMQILFKDMERSASIDPKWLE